MASVEHIIGIDLGTTNSVVAIIENGSPIIILNQEGQPKTPSVVAFQEDGDVVVGEIARRTAATQPQRTISSIKRLIGRLKQELEECEEIYPFNIAEDDHGMATVVVDNKSYPPEQISALILQKLKAAAEEHLGDPVKKSIITVPAYFDDLQRQATLKAAEIAGLEVMRLINEPTAAAMAYGLMKDTQETVAIYDFGGGTFDFSILEIDNKTFEVLTSTGNSRLGGDDIDMAIVDFLAEKFLTETGFELRSDPITLRRLKDEAERVKCELSTTSNAAINLPFIAQVDDRALHLDMNLSRDKLEEIAEPLIEETLSCCRQAIKESGLRKGQITKVILVGGSTRMPIVQDLVEDFFGIPLFRGVNPDEVVAIGAATQGAVMSGELEEVVLLDVTPHTLAIEIKGNRKSSIIEKNSTIPIKAYKTFTTTEDNQSFVNVHLLQGEEEKASENRSLGKFTLSGIPEAKAGAPRIRVEVFVNSDGVVEVAALESHSGQEQRLVTTCTYLNAEERRAQHTSSMRRRRRKKQGNEMQEQRRKILRPVASSTGAQVEDAPVSRSTGITPVPGSDTGARGGLTSSFSEIDQLRRTPVPPKPEDTPPPAQSVSAHVNSNGFPETPGETMAAPANRSHHAETEDIPKKAFSTADTKFPPEPQPAEEVAPAPPTPAPAPDAPPRPEPQFVDVPFQIRSLVDFLQADRFDVEACQVYEQEKETFLVYCRANDHNPDVQALKVKYLVYSKQPEEAREALATMRERWPDDKAHHLELYGVLCSQFPNYNQAKRERASLATTLEKYDLAIDDLEFISKREDSAPAVFDELTSLYERVLQDNKDAQIQFKLVKMYLRKGELDEAISLLQQLVQISEHRNRANKVMGFCFWQKGLRYLAWQKFRNLAVDSEMKDVLYRLAADMEKNDELVHAAHVLERIIEVDVLYKDCGERLKKINYRVDLMQDQRYGLADHTEDGSKEKVIGERFEILNEINRGSMGIVYKARDKILDEVVALKVLNDFLCADPHSVKRFKSEAKAARRLTHGHIVRIHDFCEFENVKAISMEYIEGEDMRTILARNMTFNEDMTMVYLRQICNALAYAHRLGIVHRDIKPANIMIDEQNQVKVTDFGIAKVINAAATKSSTMIVGTPLYMAPEQIDGRQVDQRADIYALGIMLYEMVTGSPPFYEGNIEYQHLHKRVPPITINVTEDLKNIIYKCLEKEPDTRFQSIDEVMQELTKA